MSSEDDLKPDLNSFGSRLPSLDTIRIESLCIKWLNISTFSLSSNIRVHLRLLEGQIADVGWLFPLFERFSDAAEDKDDGSGKKMDGGEWSASSRLEDLRGWRDGSPGEETGHRWRFRMIFISSAVVVDEVRAMRRRTANSPSCCGDDLIRNSGSVKRQRQRWREMTREISI